MTWLDWDGRDRELEATSPPSPRSAAPIPRSRTRASSTGARRPRRHSRRRLAHRRRARPKSAADWQSAPSAALAMVLAAAAAGDDGRLAVLFNRSGHEIVFHLPARDGHAWEAQDGTSPSAPLGRLRRRAAGRGALHVRASAGHTP